ncbi:MAG: hypothetical protein GY751_25330 [Bacteroidetes bacterium]|nr:hypothetical protein [Bacteroidota bacterium]
MISIDNWKLRIDYCIASPFTTENCHLHQKTTVYTKVNDHLSLTVVQVNLSQAVAVNIVGDIYVTAKQVSDENKYYDSFDGLYRSDATRR